MSSSDDGTIRIWDTNGYKLLRILEGHTNKVKSVDFSSDNLLLASGSCDKSINIWSLLTYELVTTL